MSSTILIVDDEPKIVEVLTLYLKADGFHVLTASTGLQAVEFAESYPIGLIVLDLMLPDLTGEEVCRKIRGFSRVPILMLTAKSTEADRVAGLSIGADDYLVKPFSPRELTARVRAILRRIGDHKVLSDLLEIGALHISLEAKTVKKDGSLLELTPNEYRLLVTLARYPGRIWSRDELVSEVLGIDFAGIDRTIDTHIKNLRQKIEDDPREPAYIKTVYKLGYRLDLPER
ncbi:DNA-binding response regulator [Brevibacillus fluminis]|uniref:DNA-binding response regulator n=1 Tax=Brevibacillus fluminis TaxID=511487 RepID=A0A3M8D9P7_9BACL|nr:response regulator transcription factor [Brevibacillus fluminis]RNB84623.1 DNA-binding response regulator [Brevibacillus fluminis]